VATAYFGFRVYARGEAFRTPALLALARRSLQEIPQIAREIREYPVKPAAGGQWTWVEDADAGLRYYEAIARTGWPARTQGVANPYGGMTLPLEQP
jgi:hypothetical protein